MRSSTGRAYSLLFFFSGATGLVYELLWVRILYQSFGSTIQSITTVVAAYMGGLGLGAWLLGRKADRHPRPAALYGWLEIAIGASHRAQRSEEHTSELQSRSDLVCRLLLEKKKKKKEDDDRLYNS